MPIHGRARWLALLAVVCGCTSAMHGPGDDGTSGGDDTSTTGGGPASAGVTGSASGGSGESGDPSSSEDSSGSSGSGGSDDSGSSGSGDAGSTSSGSSSGSGDTDGAGSSDSGSTGSGSTGSSDGSSSTGPTAACGNGVPEVGEECDDLNDDDTDACLSTCVAASCGDGFVWAGVEDCDDGNDVDADGCNTDCLVSGSEAWTVTYDGGDADVGNGVAVDGNGDVAVVGTTRIAGQDDIFVHKYAGDGTPIWTLTVDGPDLAGDAGQDVAVDADDNMIVVGSVTTGGVGAGWIRKYDPDGNELWTVTEGDVGQLLGVAVDSASNVITSGFVFVAGQCNDIRVRKYDADGALLWTRTFNGAANLCEAGYDVAVDSGDNVVAGGYTDAASMDGWIRKYDPDGSALWTDTLDGGAADTIYGVAADTADNVIAVGFTTTMAEGVNAWIRQYDPDGAVQWTVTYNSGGAQGDYARGIAVDGADDIVVIGWENRPDLGEGNNVFVRKYDGAGSLWWSRDHDGPAGGDDGGRRVAVGPDGRVHAVGYESVAGQATDAWLRAYEP